MLLAITGITSIYNLLKLSQLTEDIYRHPFVVSNAVRSIDTNLISMHRYMKDVALSRNDMELESAIHKVNEHEKLALKEFDIVFKQFLGDKSKVQTVYQAVLDWKIIRDEVITLMRSGKKQQAAQITKGKGAEHIFYLNSTTQVLIKYETNKAETFYQKAVTN